MVRVRRLAPLAVLAVLAALVLTGCRSQPWVAAYVGKDATITEKDIDRIIDDARPKVDQQNKESKGKVNPSTGQAMPPKVLPKRSDVAQTLVSNEVLKRMIEEQKLTPVTAQPDEIEQFADSLGIPRNTKYLADRVKMYLYIATIEGKVGPVEPTEAELRGVYDRAKAAGEQGFDAPFEEIKQQLDGEQVRTALGMARSVSEKVDRYHVRINPRYRSLEVPILPFNSGTVAVGAPLSSTDAR